MLVIESGQTISFDLLASEFPGLSEIAWRLFNEDGEKVADGSLAPDVEQIVIQATYNEVSDGSTATSRMLVLEYRAASGTTNVRHFYTVQSLSPLREGVNSCQTYLKALAMVPSMPPMDSWGTSTDLQRVSALIGAFDNLKYLSLRDGFHGVRVANGRRGEGLELPTRVADLSPDEWLLLPEEFRFSFARAQLIEANHILGYDTPEVLRERGVLSYSSGEVKQFFRTQKPLELGVCKAALRMIGRYVEYSRRLARG